MTLFSQIITPSSVTFDRNCCTICLSTSPALPLAFPFLVLLCCPSVQVSDLSNIYSHSHCGPQNAISDYGTDQLYHKQKYPRHYAITSPVLIHFSPISTFAPNHAHFVIPTHFHHPIVCINSHHRLRSFLFSSYSSTSSLPVFVFNLATVDRGFIIAAWALWRLAVTFVCRLEYSPCLTLIQYERRMINRLIDAIDVSVISVTWTKSQSIFCRSWIDTSVCLISSLDPDDTVVIWCKSQLGPAKSSHCTFQLCSR